MITFTLDEYDKLHELGFSQDSDLDFWHDKITDLSCYKSNEKLYHILYDGEDIEVENFEEFVKMIKTII